MTGKEGTKADMIKVFIVEDEIIIRESIHHMIPWEDYGFEYAGEAADGEMALPMIRELKPDLVITDIKMPFMDGLALSEIIKEELPDTKIIIISGYDDFEYARRAISLGVEQYLLKPVRKVDFIEVLEKIQKKFAAESEQRVSMETFQTEVQEYEKHSRRDFFEMLISGNSDSDELLKRAKQLEIDLRADSYNLIFFEAQAKESEKLFNREYSERVAELHEKMLALFTGVRDYILFRNQGFSYVVVVKGSENHIAKKTQNRIQKLADICSAYEDSVTWAICCGKTVQKPDEIYLSYRVGMQLFAYRYMGCHGILGSQESFEDDSVRDMEESSFRQLDGGAVDPSIIKNFLCTAQIEETENFVENYVHMLGETAFISTMFRQYILLNIHFSVASFAKLLGYDKERLEIPFDKMRNASALSAEEVKEVICEILKQGIVLREENAKGKYQGIISKAIQYMEKNYADEKLTLNQIARVTNVSPNHFSALFSQEVGQTFIEYLTALRMAKAKELLKCTDKRSGEIAFEVGYNDSHYFSFLFKKTQGMTPSEYRNGKGKDHEDN